MPRRKSFIYLSIILFVIVLIPLCFYIYSANKINFYDESRYYDFIFKENDLLRSELNEIGIWELRSGSGSLLNDVNELDLILTDKAQKRFAFYDKKNNLQLWTADSEVKKNKVIVYVNLNPKLVSYLSNESRSLVLNQLILSAFLTTLKIYNTDKSYSSADLVATTTLRSTNEEFKYSNPFSYVSK